MGKKKIFPLLSVLVVSYFLFGFKGLPLLTELNPSFEPYLYQVQIPNRSQPIFLLGTQHDIPLDRFPEAIRKIAFQMNLLIEEFAPQDQFRPMGELSWLSRQDLKNLGLFREQGFQWVSRVSIPTKDGLERTFGSPLKSLWQARLDQVHPVLLRYSLKDHLEALQQGNGIDDEIETLFRKQHKPVIALENDRERMVAEGTLVQLQKEAREIQKRVELGKTQGSNLNVEFESLFQQIERTRKWDGHSLAIEEMADYAQGNLDYFLDPNDPSVWKRNANWLPKILKIIERNPKSSILVMVGLSHFPGEKGLLRLLENSGFEVKKKSFN